MSAAADDFHWIDFAYATMRKIYHMTDEEFWRAPPARVLCLLSIYSRPYEQAVGGDDGLYTAGY